MDFLACSEEGAGDGTALGAGCAGYEEGLGWWLWLLLLLLLLLLWV
jgi:hypothetical protein